MSALVGKRVRTAQPPPWWAQFIDWSNPITRDMVFLASLADAGYGFCVSGANVFPLTGGAQRNTPQGTGAFSSGSTSIFNVSGHGLTTTNYSLFAFATCNSASVTQNALDMDNAAPRYFQFRITSGKVDFIPFNTSAAVTGQCTAATALSVTEMSRGFTMGATASPTRTACFQNGVLAATATPSSLIAPSNGQALAVGARATNTAGWWNSGALMLTVAWNRTLSDAEMGSLSDNPWQLIKPQFRRLFMVSPSSSADGTAPITGVSAASGTGTVTASGGASVTLSGVSAASSTGTVTASGGASATLPGVSAASAVGGLAVGGGASASLTPVSGATAVGSVGASGGANTALTGVFATSAVGTIVATAGGSATAPITGVSAASGTGTVTASGGASVTLGAVSSNGKANDMTVTGGASSGPLAVSASFAVGTISATGTSGSATVNLAGVAAAAGVGTISATGTRTTIDVNVTEDMICTAVRAYIKSIAPTLPIRRTPVNRAAMPNGAYVSFTPGLRRALSTNVASNDTNSRTVRRPEQMSFQIDCYGAGSAELAETLNVLYRDPYACDVFAASGLEIVPLYAGDIQQAPFTNDADQYEERYTFEIELQVNSSITVPLQSCNILGIDLISVDANYPPTEE